LLIFKLSLQFFKNCLISPALLSRMKKQTYLKVIAVASLSALASCSPSPEVQKMQVSSSLRAGSSSTSSGKIHDAVNAYRRSHGAKDLQRHAGLDRLAQAHSEFLRQNRGKFGLHGKNVSHYGFDGRSLAVRERYNMMNLGENVAAAAAPLGDPGPTFVKLWKASKAHEHNMRDSWTHTGIGVVVDADGMVFSTQLFSTISYTQMESRNRFNRF
jgi:uncharacterized protein YkwD